MKLFLDEGSQLLKACKEMEISWVDVSKDLNSRYQVGVELEACPWVATTTTGRSSAASGRSKSSLTPFTAVSKWTLWTLWGTKPVLPGFRMSLTTSPSVSAANTETCGAWNS